MDTTIGMNYTTWKSVLKRITSCTVEDEIFRILAIPFRVLSSSTLSSAYHSSYDYEV